RRRRRAFSRVPDFGTTSARTAASSTQQRKPATAGSRCCACGSGRVERLDEREIDGRREPIARLSVLAGVADALDRGGISEEVADTRDEDADAVLGVGRL